MTIHAYVLFIAALIPLFVGFIWYHPKAFGNAWMKSIGATPESMKSGKQKYISVKFGQMKVRVYGSAAVVNADAMVAYTTDGKGGTNHLAFTHVFAKKGGKWQLVSHQSLRLEK